MKEKNLKISLLMDFYGEILTDKQKEVIDYYYNDDLSLAEIAEHAQITRQGVRDCIKRGEATLLFMEEKLGLAQKFEQMRGQIEQIESAADRINAINTRYCFSRDIGRLAETIRETAQALNEE